MPFIAVKLNNKSKTWLIGPSGGVSWLIVLPQAYVTDEDAESLVAAMVDGINSTGWVAR